MMRLQIKNVYDCQKIIGCEGNHGNHIDAVFIPAETTNTGGKRKCVMLCPPNAGIYETHSMSSRDDSWIGFYLHRGYNVCLWNYRGAGLSQGYPSPVEVCDDGARLAAHVTDEYNIEFMVVHGESMGGKLL